MKIKLILKQKTGTYGVETRLTHIKLMDSDGRYVKFLKHDPELIAILNDIVIDTDSVDMSS